MKSNVATRMTTIISVTVKSKIVTRMKSRNDKNDNNDTGDRIKSNVMTKILPNLTSKSSLFSKVTLILYLTHQFKMYLMYIIKTKRFLIINSLYFSFNYSYTILAH